VIFKSVVLDKLIEVVLFPVVLVAGKMDQVLCKVDVITVVSVGQGIVFSRCLRGLRQNSSPTLQIRTSAVSFAISLHRAQGRFLYRLDQMGKALG